MASRDHSDQPEKKPPEKPDKSEKSDRPDKPEKAEKPGKEEKPRRGPPSPAVKKRLQKCFEIASKQMAQENYDYATALFTDCVWGDPGNKTYVQNFLANLQKKHGKNRKPSLMSQLRGWGDQLGTLGTRSAVKKALAQNDWDEVIKNGLAVLKVNPWDKHTLIAMSTASERFATMLPGEFLDCQLFYLKTALEANPKDPDVNRLLGIALGKRGQFDNAIACWHRVEQARPDDDEPKRAIATLAVEKTLKFDDADPSKVSAKDKNAPKATQEGEELTPIERMQRRIVRNPADIAAYYELAQLFFNEDRYQEAEDVMHKAYEASNHDGDVRDKWDDARVRHMRHECVLAEKRARETGSDEAKADVKRTAQQLNELLLEIYKSRSERYPANLAFRFDLGQQYRILGHYSEAIKELQVARNDARRKGVCLLQLGECFRSIKQYRLAMSHYEEAIQEIPDRDVDSKKAALYRAGKLAFAMKDRERAQKYLGLLASMDFSYRDISDLLDQLGKWGEQEDNKGKNKDKDKGEAKGGDEGEQGEGGNEAEGKDQNS
jgi:tetratricopeptide (TPR) repeat protein